MFAISHVNGLYVVLNLHKAGTNEFIVGKYLTLEQAHHKYDSLIKSLVNSNEGEQQ